MIKQYIKDRHIDLDTEAFYEGAPGDLLYDAIPEEVILKYISISLFC